MKFTCIKCNTEKYLCDFSKDKKSKTGHRYVCKQCQKNINKRRYDENKDEILKKSKQYYSDNKSKFREYYKKYYSKNKEKSQQYAKKYYRENIETISKYSKKYHAENTENRRVRDKKNRKILTKNTNRHRLKNPNKHKARSAVLRALKKRVLIRQPCKVCGSVKSIEAHHHSYKKEFWLDVTWLCHTHHQQEHTSIRGISK